MIKMFMGGTCNESTWRDELISKLDLNKIEPFNPMVKNWNEIAQANEDYHKENDDICLYTLTPEMIGIYSIFEIGLDAGKKPDRIILCILEEANGRKFDSIMLKGIEKMKKDLSNLQIPIFDNLDDLSVYLNNYEKIKKYIHE